MKFFKRIFLALIAVGIVILPVRAAEEIHWDVVEKIRTEAFSNSRVMEFAGYLTDVYGPRLAHSPSYDESTQWAKETFESFGISEVALEEYGEFGVSWEVEFVSAHMLTPQYMPIIAYPNTWSRGTDGEVRGHAVHINLDGITAWSDLDPYRGKLRDAIIMIEPLQEILPLWEPVAVRYDDAQLDELAKTNIAEQMERERDGNDGEEGLSRSEIVDFLFAEGAAALAAPDGRESYGTVLVNEVPGQAWKSMDAIHPPFLVFAAEHYNRIVRVLEKGIDVEMLVDVRIAISDDDPTDYNVIADLPGSSRSGELVMLGAHLDANSPGTGATDNVSGVAVVMEAMRILKAIGVEPVRTIRAALWGGEEYGLVGSEKYIEKHFGGGGGVARKRDHEKLSIYFNRDGGGGRIRGIQLQGNEQIRPILSAWLAPLRPLGVAHLMSKISPNSDQAPFNDAGLPAVSFLHDPIELRAYHTNMDTYERLIPEDLVQASIVMAILSYEAAMRDEAMPRRD